MLDGHQIIAVTPWQTAVLRRSLQKYSRICLSMSSRSVSLGEPFGPLAGNSQRPVDDERREQPLAAFFYFLRLSGQLRRWSLRRQDSPFGAHPSVFRRQSGDFGTFWHENMPKPLWLSPSQRYPGVSGFPHGKREFFENPTRSIWQVLAVGGRFFGLFEPIFRHV